MPDIEESVTSLDDLFLDDPGWVLIAEDEIEIADLLRLVVSRITGMNVQICLAGDEALELISRRQRPVAALLDVMLPGADGIQIAQAIRALDEGHRTRIIFLTAVPRERIEKDVAEIQPFAFLRKPMSLKELSDEMLNAFASAEQSIELSAELSEEISEYLSSINPD